MDLKRKVRRLEKKLAAERSARADAAMTARRYAQALEGQLDRMTQIAARIEEEAAERKRKRR